MSDPTGGAPAQEPTPDDASTRGDGQAPGGVPAADGATIRVRVRLFARLRELAGARAVDIELPVGATVDDAWSEIAAATPAIGGLHSYVRFAVDGAYADATTPLVDGSEVACIPPVSGGSGDEAGDDTTDAADADKAGDSGPTGDRRPTGGRGGAATSEAGDSDPAGDRDPTGGRGGAAGRPRRVLEVTETPFGASILADLAARVATDEDGALVAFLGLTRATPGTPAPGEEAEASRHAGRRVDALEYEAFEPLALRVLAEIADEAVARFGVVGLAIVHRTGRVPLGEPSVAIVAVAPHRAAAFAAASYAIDETKARAPIWKAEMFVDGHVWVGATARTGPADDGLSRPERPPETARHDG